MQLLNKKYELQSERTSSRNKKCVLSPIIIPKIIHVLVNMDSIERTSLASKAKINYSDMVNQIEWMEKKRVINVTLENGKIVIKLNNSWCEFAEMQMELYGL